MLDESMALLQRLEDRLEAVSELVSALGMLEVHTVVMDDLSPLYFPERAGAPCLSRSPARSPLSNADERTGRRPASCLRRRPSRPGAAFRVSSDRPPRSSGRLQPCARTFPGVQLNRPRPRRN